MIHASRNSHQPRRRRRANKAPQSTHQKSLTGANRENGDEKQTSVSSVSSFLTHPVHPLFEKASGLTETIIGAAIEVHRDKGPALVLGLLVSSGNGAYDTKRPCSTR